MRIDRSGDGDASGPHPDTADGDQTRGTEEADGDGASRADHAAGIPGEPHASHASHDSQAVRRAVRIEYYARVDAAFRAHAVDQAYAKIQEIEEKTVTPAMRRIEAADAGRCLAGLEHRLKGKDRLTEKVTSDVAKKGVTVEQALNNVKDAIRYTLCYPADRYAEGVYADCDRLRAEGFDLVERRGSWDKEQYKGLNSRWRVPGDSQLFEVQFHTQASLDAKEETHWAYEKLRVGVPAPAEQKELEDYQKRITARVPIPPGALEIPDHP